MNDQELFLLIVISVLVMIALSVGILVLYNISQNRILQEVEASHKKELEYQTKLLTNSIEVQEKERARIAKDLHDEIGSKLNIVNLNINLLKTTIAASEQSNSIIDQIESSLEESITRARDISHDLYPPILDKFGLQSAINSLAGAITKTKTIVVHLDIEHEWKQLDKEEEFHLYRILQELVNNTIKHAQAENIWISSDNKAKDFTLTYRDDGVGLGNSVLQAESTGLGMSSIETRASLLGASIRINDDNSTGYQVKITM